MAGPKKSFSPSRWSRGTLLALVAVVALALPAAAGRSGDGARPGFSSAGLEHLTEVLQTGARRGDYAGALAVIWQRGAGGPADHHS